MFNGRPIFYTKKTEQKIEQLEQTIRDRERMIDALRFNNDELQLALHDTKADLEQTQKQLQDALTAVEQLENTKTSDGWFILTGQYSGSGGVQVNLDWSDEFIRSLHTNGITGESDDVIVRKWLLLASEQIIDDLEERIVDNNSDHAGTEYV